MGFQFYSQELLLKNFLKFTEQCGDAYIRNKTVIKWAKLAPSQRGRRNRLLIVHRFAIVVQMQDKRNQVPPPNFFGKMINKRRKPYILSDDELKLLLTESSRLMPKNTIRPLTYSTLFALLAATGLRVGEAIALNIKDLTKEGLIIRSTKFRKDRLVPIHETTRQALNNYLEHRMKYNHINQSLFISNRGSSLCYDTVHQIFRQLLNLIGLFDSSGNPKVRIHDLRHRFAVKSLEQCHQKDRIQISQHMIALSTYLGHTDISNTYWYLHSTPSLMAQIAEVQEQLYKRERK